MAKDVNNEKLLKGNVLDNVTYTKREIRSAWLKLILGLWGVFAVVLTIFILCTKHIIG